MMPLKCPDKIYSNDRSRGERTGRSEGRYGSDDRDRTPTRYDSPVSTSDASSRVAPTPSTGSTGSYSSYKTAEERAAFIKQQAEQRMAERLAALGIRPINQTGESAAQRQAREKKEREDKLRQAEEEDAKREQERQRRIADEQITPPVAAKSSAKKPPPPPSRKVTKSDEDSKRKLEEDARKAEQERALRAEQEAQEAKRRSME